MCRPWLEATVGNLISGDAHMTQVHVPEVLPSSSFALAAHRGVQVLGDQGMEGRKAFFIQIEARPGQEEAVVQMLRDIRACVEAEPATGPWFAVRFSQTSRSEEHTSELQSQSN